MPEDLRLTHEWHPRIGRLVAASVVVLAMGSFQTGATLAKGLFVVFGPLGTAGLRIGLAAMILCGLWRPWRGRLDRDAALAVVLYGLSLGAMNACFYEALARLPLGVTVAIEFVGPLGVALIGSRRWLDLIWVALVLAGLALLLRPHGAARLDPAGIAFAVLAACGWATYIVCGVRLGRLMPPGRATAIGMLVAALLVVPAASLSLGPLLRSPRLLAVGFGVAILSSALPYLLELAAMRRMSARGFGLLMSAEPAVAAISGSMLLDERLAPARWLGIGLVMAASAGSVLYGEHRR